MNILKFYIDGFRQMQLGRLLWKVILIKLFIMFVVIKFAFFNESLNSKFKKEEEKANFVIQNLLVGELMYLLISWLVFIIISYKFIKLNIEHLEETKH
ncbi:hypothetical protein CHL14416_04540 [Campylobacter hyointestinalis subsp. lawsonii]|nr:hypothetical protein CHL14416_04540 [Campylobacter hyointestinalis subsp. lawsonii]